MNRLLFFIPVLTALLLTSCSTLQKTPKYKFTEGIYSMATKEGRQKVYVDPSEDSIYLYAMKKIGDKFEIDVSKPGKEIMRDADTGFKKTSAYTFRKSSIDVDFLTIPLKYRFSVAGFPNQLNTNLNGAIYLGLRTDAYHAKNKTTPLAKTTRTINHFGFSFGILTGLGSTAVNPSVTNNNIDIEYDGVAFINGVTMIIGINNITLGVAGGFDHLLDNNRQYWIYQQKPWLGLSFGLNLN